MEAVALYDDGWAIRALPPGRRDLGCFELWDRSLERSRRRRARAARNTGLPVRAVSAALLTATVVAPAADLATAQDDRRRHHRLPPARRRGPGRRGRAAGARDPRRRRLRPQTRAAVIAFQAAPRARGRRRHRPDDARGARRRRLGDAAADRSRRRCSGCSGSPPTASTARSRARRCAATRRPRLLVDGVAGPQTLGSLGLPTDVTLGEEARGGRRSAPLSSLRCARRSASRTSGRATARPRSTAPG